MDNYSSLDNVFGALADPTRRAVIQRLGRGPASVKDLSAPFEMALPSFMKHIAVLEKSGLLKSEKLGRIRICRIKEQPLAAAQQWVAEQRALWEARTDRLDDYAQNLAANEKE